MIIVSDPYFCGETSGLKKAAELKPSSFGRKLRKANSVLFILASEVGMYPKEVLKDMVKRTNATVYKTEAAGTEDVDIVADARYGLMETVDRLCNGDNNFDYVVLVGVPYHIETRVLSGLRSYGVKNVVTLNWRHQQYAAYSFPNILDPGKWEQSLNGILGEL